MKNLKLKYKVSIVAILVGFFTFLSLNTVYSFGYIFAGEANGIDIVAHPIGYTGTGGVLNVTVGIDPTSVNSANMVISTQNTIIRLNERLSTTGNLQFGLPSGDYDFESVLLHEMGHSVGLSHCNLGSQTGVSGANTDYTHSTDGVDNVFSFGAGTDGIIGTADDVRGDDVNLNFFKITDNNPFTAPATIDQTTYSRNLADLPSGNFSANGSRDVAPTYGVAGTESALQQGTFNTEYQRTLAADDVAGIRYAMAGLDEIAGTADDYVLRLTYAGLTASADIVIDFDNAQTGFAVSQSGGSFIVADHVRITTNSIYVNSGFSWYFNTVAIPLIFSAPSDLCSDAGVQTGLGGASPSGGAYSGPGVTDDGNGLTYSFNPSVAGVGTHTITYTNGTSTTDTIEVFALPTASYVAPADLCVNAGIQTGLGGGTPTGGVYSGPGVSDNGNGSTYSFDPNAAGSGVHTITYDYDDSNGCSDSASDSITVGVAKTWDGTNWSPTGAPDATNTITFNADYNTSTDNIDACSCEVANNATVTVGAGDYMNIDGNITVGTGSSLIVEHTGSIVQVDDAAVVTNNGTINVNLTTPALNARDFLIMGSPMTAEDDAMFSAYQVLNHTTANFTPYVGTPPIVGVNFHDQESNDWSNYTGTLNPGEGYLVRPSYTTGTTYNYVYDAGTLNNGVITYSAFFGDDKEDSPNVMSNPYASAIDADLLISSNAIIDELYFWEHNTTPAVGVPGPLSQNFNSEDISTRNFMMGVAAATGGGIPTNIISTGQGFGIKANAAGDVTFNNALRLTAGNGTIRQTMDKDLLWIEVRENTYGMGSTAGIGFTEGATPGIDSGYDTMKLGTVVSLYSHLANGSEQLGIQGREAFDSSITIPMGFSTLIEADAGIPYVINISNLEGINIEQATVYLIDHLTNTITNLSTDRYEFLSDAGTFDNRFTLQFENLVLGTNDTVLESVSVYPNPAQNILNIVSPKAVVTAVAVYDVRGRVVSERVFTSAGINYQVDLSGLETALYFVKISTESGTITKRVVKQ